VYEWSYGVSILWCLYLHNLLNISPLLTVHLRILVDLVWFEPFLTPVPYNLDIWDRSA
jgi:hypothetical protein